MEIISSRKNESVRFMRELFRDKSLRGERGLIAVEGEHLCRESCASGYDIELFAYTERAASKYAETVEVMRNSARNTVIITEEVAEYISDTKSPQGLFAAAVRRDGGLSAQSRRVVVLDGIQDPGNVGTIIRTAEAFGFDGAVMIGACADAFSPKALRASMGSALRLPIESCSAGELSGLLRGFAIFGAMLDSSAVRLGEAVFPERCAVVIGSEGSGISPEVISVCTGKLYIPIWNAESLNAAVAAAVIMWEMRKQ